MNTLEQALAGAARKGDAVALQALISRHYPLVLAFARSVLRHGSDAEDAAQETFFKVVRSIGRFGLRCSFSTWLHRVARNTVSDHLRRRRSRNRLEEARTAVRPPAPPGAAAPDPRPLEALLAALPSDERDLLRSVYADGTPVRRVADRLGLPLSAVRWRLFRLRKRLRAAVRYRETGGLR